METLTVEQQLEQCQAYYAHLSREFQAYREEKEAEILALKDELWRKMNNVSDLIGELTASN